MTGVDAVAARATRGARRPARSSAARARWRRSATAASSAALISSCGSPTRSGRTTSTHTTQRFGPSASRIAGGPGAHVGGVLVVGARAHDHHLGHPAQRLERDGGVRRRAADLGLVGDVAVGQQVGEPGIDGRGPSESPSTSVARPARQRRGAAVGVGRPGPTGCCRRRPGPMPCGAACAGQRGGLAGVAARGVRRQPADHEQGRPPRPRPPAAASRASSGVPRRLVRHRGCDVRVPVQHVRMVAGRGASVSCRGAAPGRPCTSGSAVRWRRRGRPGRRRTGRGRAASRRPCGLAATGERSSTPPRVRGGRPEP